MFRLRAYEPNDAAAVAAIRNQFEPYPNNAEDIQAWYRIQTGEPGNTVSWLVATEPESEPGSDARERVVGYTTPLWSLGMPAGLFYGEIAVGADLRGRGIGTALLSACERFAREHGGTELEVFCQGEDAASLAWAERRGFFVDRVRTESVLDLAHWDGSRFTKERERVSRAGIRLLALAGAEVEPYLPGIYEVDVATCQDVPIMEGEIPPFETWMREWKEDPAPRMTALALDGDRPVGMSIVSLPRERGGQAGTRYTAVRREYRGRGVALALKLVTIDAAQAAGVATMRTNNDPDNPAMLRVNQKLGYRMVPGPKRLKKRL